MALLHRSHPGTEHAPEARSGQPPAAPAPAHARRRRDWKKTLVIGVVSVALLIAAYFILAAFIPRWWSQRIGDAVSGSLSSGTIIGLCIGFTFTLLPLLVLTLAARPHTRWKLRVTWIVLALILAAPNLATLTIVAGDGSGAHAGQRTMDVNAPAFRGASLGGALIGLGVYLLVMFFMLSRRPGRRRGKDNRRSEKAARAAEQDNRMA